MSDETTDDSANRPPAGSHLRAAFRLPVLFAWLVLWLGPFLAVRGLGLGEGKRIVHLWHRGACRITGIRVSRHGTPCDDAPLLLISNHTSYLDIPVLNSIARLNFIAKDDVRGWPVIGFLAQCCETVFVERRPIRSRAQIDVLRERILPDRRIVLFAEGTSTDGRYVLPFKSSLLEFVFDAEIGARCKVQAVTVLPTCPAPAPDAPRTPESVIYPWYDDTPLHVHFWRFLKTPSTHVHVVFHDPMDAAAFEDRKQMTTWAHARVREGHERIVSGG